VSQYIQMELAVAESGTTDGEETDDAEGEGGMDVTDEEPPRAAG
jgi:hypothetical protein